MNLFIDILPLSKWCVRKIIEIKATQKEEIDIEAIVKFTFNVLQSSDSVSDSLRGAKCQVDSVD